ncbi:hypothetical protein BOTNAR_0492g00090 [Botryotinia narcissicola]|uniref:Uncharacterized protein n=1 Tax=Botryotinia narcissicola TaxID=278944 RepID=A0A4Z1HTH3_9HELO|nr:hypothetical protein BOTNAR_0492g00090 [Botryotinia narcissicola]
MEPSYKGLTTSRLSDQELKEKIGKWQPSKVAVNSHFVIEGVENLTKIGNIITFHRNISTAVRFIRPTAPLQDLVESYEDH